jgi:hypothetical protein
MLSAASIIQSQTVGNINRKANQRPPGKCLDRWGNKRKSYQLSRVAGRDLKAVSPKYKETKQLLIAQEYV